MNPYVILCIPQGFYIFLTFLKMGFPKNDSLYIFYNKMYRSTIKYTPNLFKCSLKAWQLAVQPGLPAIITFPNGHGPRNLEFRYEATPIPPVSLRLHKAQGNPWASFSPWVLHRRGSPIQSPVCVIILAGLTFMMWSRSCDFSNQTDFAGR